jgi:ABC-type transport system substrate-binding protein
MFLNDTIWLHFYTHAYLKKYGWNGKSTCANLTAPGPYGLGPYILSKGYLEGDRSTPEVVLKANPNYWGDIKPKIETITIYTNLELAKARDMVLESEGKLDLTSVSFSDEVATVLSPYAKLAVSASTNSYAVHFNMINGNAAIKDERIRFAINHAIKREDLLNLAMLGEGNLTPALVSANYYRVNEAISSLSTYFNQYQKAHPDNTEDLRRLVQTFQREHGLNPEKPLRLNFLTQESFLFLIREIKYFLSAINIDLHLEITSSEKQVFHQLLSTWKNKNKIPWDMLIWGDFDWLKHPWATFFVLKPFNAWSTIPPNRELDSLTNLLVRTAPDSKEYVPMISELIRTSYEHNYMLFLPTPNNVYAVNKELVFNPGRAAFVYLNELEVTNKHWSIRKRLNNLKGRQKPLAINRRNFSE